MIALTLKYLRTPWSKIVVLVALTSVCTLVRPYEGFFTPYHLYEHIIIGARLLE